MECKTLCTECVNLIAKSRINSIHFTLTGIGNDPREDRKFNMIKQAMDYDADGSFVRQWVPELKCIAGSRIHLPWTLNEADLSIRLGQDYPKPVIIAPEWIKHSGPKV